MTEATRELLGQRIKTLRKRAKLNQEDVAERVGIDVKSLSRIESGRHFPALETLESIAAVLGCPLIDFFDFPGEESEGSMRAYLHSAAQTLELASLRRVVRTIRLELGTEDVTP